MSLSAKKRARRIRGQWAKWWRSRPAVDPEYGVSFVDPRTGKTAKVIGTFTKAKNDPLEFMRLVAPDVAVQNFQRALFDRMTGKKAAPEGYGMTLPFGYAIARDFGDANKPLAIVDIKGMNSALAKSLDAGKLWEPQYRDKLPDPWRLWQFTDKHDPRS